MYHNHANMKSIIMTFKNESLYTLDILYKFINSKISLFDATVSAGLLVKEVHATCVKWCGDVKSLF